MQEIEKRKSGGCDKIECTKRNEFKATNTRICNTEKQLSYLLRCVYILRKRVVVSCFVDEKNTADRSILRRQRGREKRERKTFTERFDSELL